MKKLTLLVLTATGMLFSSGYANAGCRYTIVGSFCVGSGASQAPALQCKVLTCTAPNGQQYCCHTEPDGDESEQAVQASADEMPTAVGQ